MRAEEAVAGIAYLCACTPGWNDEAVAMYTKQAMRFQDPDLFLKAMEQLAMRWDKPTRPLPHDITIAYQHAQADKELDDRYALTEGRSSTTYPTFAEGVAIAWEAYQQECKRQGKEPNRSVFNRWIQ